MGTGVGSKAYSIVEQGKVDELVNSKPEERRGLIEEAAGTSKYKSRKIVAEKKLERTQQNLLRLNDIVREIERQIRSMELQAKKAERYRALKSELKEKELACEVSCSAKPLRAEIARQENRARRRRESPGRTSRLAARPGSGKRIGPIVFAGSRPRDRLAARNRLPAPRGDSKRRAKVRVLYQGSGAA